jgi:hypothetical protein
MFFQEPLFKWVRETSDNELKKTSKFESPQNPEVFLNFHEFGRDVFFSLATSVFLTRVLHRWNYCYNDVNYFIDIKKLFLLGNFLLFFRIITG